jgi:ketol-acid reductoisomerase
MATIHRDGDLSLLDGTVAVIGFGSQGHAHALNLYDSGVDVVVGLREGSGSQAAAEEAGLTVAPIAEAVRSAQVVALLVPDHVQKGVWDADVAPSLAPGAAVLFAHGLNIHFGRIAPPEEHDVIMVAPKAPGHRVRELFVSGAGTPGLVAVHRDAGGRALELALCSRPPSPRRPRATSSASRPCSAAAFPRSSRPASTCSSRRATSPRSPTTSA